MNSFELNIREVSTFNDSSLSTNPKLVMKQMKGKCWHWQRVR